MVADVPVYALRVRVPNPETERPVEDGPGPVGTLLNASIYPAQGPHQVAKRSITAVPTEAEATDPHDARAGEAGARNPGRTVSATERSPVLVGHRRRFGPDRCVRRGAPVEAYRSASMAVAMAS